MTRIKNQWLLPRSSPDHLQFPIAAAAVAAVEALVPGLQAALGLLDGTQATACDLA